MKLDPARFPKDGNRSADDRTTGPAAFALDGDAKTAWTNETDPAHNNDPAVLTFELAEPFKTDGTAHLTYTLSQHHGGYNSDDNQTYNLGRIRLSVAATLPNALDQLPPLVREALESPRRNETPDSSAASSPTGAKTTPAFATETAEIRKLSSATPVPHLGPRRRRVQDSA